MITFTISILEKKGALHFAWESPAAKSTTPEEVKVAKQVDAAISAIRDQHQCVYKFNSTDPAPPGN